MSRPAGWPEWLLAVACATLAAHTLSVVKQSQTLQSGLYFYTQAAPVGPVRAGALAVDASAIALTALWIARPGWGAWIGRGLAAVSCAGIALSWYELGLAFKTVGSATFSLGGLPMLPLANLGIAGSSVFLAYLVARFALRSGRSLGGVVALIAVALFFAQWAAWEAVLRAQGR